MSRIRKFLEQFSDEELGDNSPVELAEVLELANQLSPEDRQKLVEALDTEAYYRGLVLESKESIRQNGGKDGWQVLDRLEKKYKDMAEQQRNDQRR